MCGEPDRVGIEFSTFAHPAFVGLQRLLYESPDPRGERST
jgi:hypothetical protein